MDQGTKEAAAWASLCASIMHGLPSIATAAVLRESVRADDGTLYQNRILHILQRLEAGLSNVPRGSFWLLLCFTFVCGCMQLGDAILH